MKIQFKYLLILMLILCAAVYKGHAETNTEIHDINISGKWKIIFNDNMLIAGDNYNDSKAPVIILPGNWLDRLRNNDSMSTTIWLRKEVIIKKSYSNYELILDLGEIGVADEVYFNGNFIGRTGGMPVNNEILDYHFAWKTARHYVIPKVLIKYDRSNIIAVRIFSHVISGLTGNQEVRVVQAGFPDRQFSDNLPVFINYFAIALNLFFCIIFFIVYLYDRKKIFYLYLVSLSISGIVMNLCLLDIPLFINGLIRFKLFFSAYTSIGYFMAMFITDIFDRPHSKSSLVLFIMYCLIICSIWFAWNTSVLIEYCVTGVVIFSLIIEFYCIAIIIFSLINNLRKYWLFLLTAPVVISILRDAYYIITLNFNDLFSVLFFHLPILITIITLFVFYSYEHQMRTGETVLQSLQRKTQRLQRDLLRAKTNNAKSTPQEIIHDLIAYLDINYNYQYNRDELSKRFGLNSIYMLQLFKKTTGKTISDYINTKRIEKAIELIVNEDIKIIDIAYNVGFENYNYFHRIFKKMTGLSPGSYRKIHIK